MPTIEPTHGSSLLANLQLPGDPGSAERSAEYLKIARFVLRTLDDYKRPDMPARPAMLTMEDHEIIDAARAEMAGLKLSADKRRQLSYFGQWRDAVWAIEEVAGMKLLGPVDSAIVFDDAALHDEADVLFSFAEEQFPRFSRANVPRSCRYWSTLRDWCRSAARDYQLLPGYLRTMRRPKGGVPFHRPQGTRGDTSAAPPLGQAQLPWEE